MSEKLTVVNQVYLVRHKATGKYMPQMRRGKGYSHWNPGTNSEPSCSLGIPRILFDRKTASRIISQWNANPNATMSGRQTYFGDYEEDYDNKPDGRTKDDLEIIVGKLILDEEHG